jgi:hypothetical protein
LVGAEMASIRWVVFGLAINGSMGARLAIKVLKRAFFMR